ncbi:MAG: hypothetical protein OEY41_17465 [Acidimicrobiia bacterium]|nr:hypothetical protein [Acidimicrobiia bacterium]
MSDTMEETGSALVPAAMSTLDIDREALFQEGYLALAAIAPGEVVPMEALEELAGSVSTLSRNSPWWLGDLLVYAAQNYGDDWHQLVDNLGHTSAEIMDRVEVAETFAPKDRLTPTDRAPGLTWVQHRLFTKPYQDKALRNRTKKLMKKAADGGWDDEQIRIEVRQLTTVETTAKEDENGAGDESRSTVLTLAVRVSAENGAEAVALLDGMEKVLSDMLIEAGVPVSEVRHRVSGVVPPSNEPPKRRGRPPKDRSAEVEGE